MVFRKGHKLRPETSLLRVEVYDRRSLRRRKPLLQRFPQGLTRVVLEIVHHGIELLAGVTTGACADPGAVRCFELKAAEQLLRLDLVEHSRTFEAAECE